MSNDDNEKKFIPDLMTQVPRMQMEPTAITPRLRTRLLERVKVNVGERNKNGLVGGLGRL